MPGLYMKMSHIMLCLCLCDGETLVGDVEESRRPCYLGVVLPKATNRRIPTNGGGRGLVAHHTDYRPTNESIEF